MTRTGRSMAVGTIESGSNGEANDETANHHHHHEISLRSLQQTSPVESYEESLLMESLERDDPTGSSMVHLDLAVALPYDFDGSDATTFASASSTSPTNANNSNHAIPSVNMDPIATNNNNPYFRPSLSRGENFRDLNPDISRKTVEEELFNLTKSINRARADHDHDHDEFAPAGHFYGYGGQQRRGSGTQQDVFARNARTILRRITHYKGKPVSVATGMSSSIGMNASSSTVNKLSEESSSDALMEGVRDFGEFLKSNRSYAYEYAKTRVMLYILPPTIVAFVLFYVFGNPGASISDSFNVIDDIFNSTNTVTEGVTETLSPKVRKSMRWDGDTASYSWWLLFFVRQTITFSVARGIQFAIVSLAQKPPSSNKPRGLGRLLPTTTTLGPMVRLILLQEKGLPLQLQIWGVLNFLFLFGTHDFAKNWCYYQDWLLIFTPPSRQNRGGNPSGGVTYHPIYRRLLLFAIFSGATVGAKRFLIGLRFGKASYQRYAGKLADILEEVVKVTKIARFASPQQRQAISYWKTHDSEVAKSSTATLQEFWSGAECVGGNENQAPVSERIGPIPMSPDESVNNFWESNKNSNNNNNNDNGNGNGNNETSDSTVEKMEQGEVAPDDAPQQEKPMLENLGLNGMNDIQAVDINELLGEWEDLDTVEKISMEGPSLSSIVQFRASCQILDSPHPFSQAFGYARTRYEVVDCSQRMYRNLIEIQKQLEDAEYERNKTRRLSMSLGAGESEAFSGPNRYHPVLRFQTLVLALQGKKHRKNIDPQKVKKLISMFRPARNGDMTMLEFCKSIDTIYKDIRKLRASIANEGKMNAASENIVNTIFYFVLAWFGIAAIGIDPMALIGVLGSIIISISFMVGGASSDYFRGLLFILVQRPYDIGDRINVNGIEKEADANGSSGWIVKDVTLYHTTVIYAKTQEYATYSNGALSKLRIINCARSPRAQLQFVMRFSIDVPHTTIEEFQNELKDYVKSKPREWLAFNGFWLVNIEADQGFVAYKIMIQHRDSWQNLAALTTALADVRQHAVNLSKQKRMQYKSPPLPVEMRMAPGTMGGSGGANVDDNNLTEAMLGNQLS